MEPASDSLESVFQRFLSEGRREDLGFVYTRVAPGLIQQARSLVTHMSDAEDVVQSVFVALARRRLRYDASRPLRPWLRGVVLNHARNHARKEKRRSGVEESVETVAREHADVAVRSEARAALREALSRLEEPYLGVVQLHLQEGLTPFEIAERIGRNRSTVRTQLERGLGLLRRLLPAGMAPLVLVSVDRIAELEERLLDAVRPHVPVTQRPRVLVAGACVALLGLLATYWFATQSPAIETPTAPVASNAQIIPSTPVVSVPSEDSRQAVQGPLPDPSGQVVRLLDANGAAIPDAILSLGIDRKSAKAPLDFYVAGRMRFARTDENGRARFEGVDPGIVSAVFLDDGLMLAKVFPTGDEITITAPTSIRWTGTVEGEDGKPVANARVYLSSLPYVLPGLEAGRTDADGRWAATVVASRMTYAWADADGHGSSRFTLLRPFAGAHSFRLRLTKEGNPVEGVVESDGVPCAGAHVRVCLLDEHGDGPAGVVRTDAEGRFRCEGLPAGPLLVIAHFENLDIGVAHVDQDAKRSNIRLHVGGHGVIHGTVVDAVAPNSKLFVSLRPALQGNDRRFLGAVTRYIDLDANGRYRIEGLTAGPKHLALHGSSRSLLTATSIALEDHGVREWSPHLRPETSIGGRLTTTEGQPLAGFEVVLKASGDILQRARSSESGSFLFRGLRGESYTLMVRPHPSTGTSVPIAVREARRGEMGFVWRLDEPRSAITVACPDPSLLLWLRRKGFPDDEDRCTARGGRLVADPVSAGTYEVAVVRGTEVHWLDDVVLVPEQVRRIDDVRLKEAAGVDIHLEGECPLEGVQISIVDSHGYSPRALRYESGLARSVVDLAPGTYTIHVDVPHARSVRMPIELLPGTRSEITVRLERALPVRFSLKFDHAYNPSPFGNLEYRIVALRDDGEHVVTDGTRPVTGEVVPIGIGLDPGRYRIEVVTGWEARVRHEFDVTEDGYERTLELR
ncbi:MAG: sigma-70 family RNA polymerase sigma factor [Planctomycetes bacterium]|nr:sigma-70 family RNA polymerase sigma factor [Planctomycetota bacterium]